MNKGYFNKVKQIFRIERIGDRSLKVILSHGNKFIRYAAVVVPCTAIRILFADILWPFLLW